MGIYLLMRNTTSSRKRAILPPAVQRRLEAIPTLPPTPDSAATTHLSPLVPRHPTRTQPHLDPRQPAPCALVPVPRQRNPQPPQNLVCPNTPYPASTECSILFCGTAALDHHRLVCPDLALGDGHDHHPQPLDYPDRQCALQKARYPCGVAGASVGQASMEPDLEAVAQCPCSCLSAWRAGVGVCRSGVVCA